MKPISLGSFRERRAMKSGVLGLFRLLFVLGKPRVSLLLFITSFTTFVYARSLEGSGLPSLQEIIIFTVAGMLAPMGANSINNYLDRDIDPLMKRTRNRPVAAGLIRPMVALLLGVTLLALSGVVFWVFFNPLASLLSITGGLYYVVVYTILLKRRTPWSTVIGGVAGSFPPLVGWAAGSGGLGLTGLLLALVIFFWNPPHFWALAMHLREDYERAGLPMMPIVAGASTSFTYMVVFSILTILTMAAVSIVQHSLILAVATLVSAVMMARAMDAIRKHGTRGALRAFKLSNPALGIFFLALLIEAGS